MYRRHTTSKTTEYHSLSYPIAQGKWRSYGAYKSPTAAGNPAHIGPHICRTNWYWLCSWAEGL